MRNWQKHMIQPKNHSNLSIFTRVMAFYIFLQFSQKSQKLATTKNLKMQISGLKRKTPANGKKFLKIQVMCYHQLLTPFLATRWKIGFNEAEVGMFSHWIPC